MASDLPTIDRQSRGLHFRAGVTLAESLIAAVVLAAAVVALAGSLSTAQQQNSVGQDNSIAMALAQELMEEMAAKPFDDPGGTSGQLGPESGENTRVRFNSVNDYDGYQDNTDAMTTMGGQSLGMNQAGRYMRQVGMQYRQSPSGSPTSSGDMALVTVTVTTPEGQQVRLSRLMARVTVGR